MTEELDIEFVLFAAPVMSRDLMRSDDPGNKAKSADFKKLLLHAQNTLEKGYEDDPELEECSELIEELFLQGMRDASEISKESIDNVLQKSFAIARALNDVV